MRIGVIGGRDFDDYIRLQRVLNVYPATVIVSGGATGADSLGARYADEKGIDKQIFPARWEDLTAEPCVIKTRDDGSQYNALAGHNRNTDIVNNCQLLVAFWDKKSTGTKDSLDKAHAVGRTTLIVYY